MQEFYQKTAWENEPSTNSPINEDNLNNIEDGIGELDSRVATLSNTKSNVDWVQMQTDGKKIAEVTIDGVKKNVYVPRGTGGSGGTSSWEDLEEKPFETLDNNNFNVSDGILSIKDKASGVEVSAIKESLIQSADWLKSKNLIEKISQGSWEDNGTLNSRVDRCSIANKIPCVKGDSFVFSSGLSNAQIYARIYDVNGSKIGNYGWSTSFTVNENNASYCLVTIRKSNDSNVTPSEIINAQIELGTEATSYSEYSISNQGLTQIVEDASNNGYIQNKNLWDGTVNKGLWIVNNVITSNASGQYTIVKCKGGKTYTVSKKNLGLLWIASTSAYPSANVPVLDVQQGGSSNTKVATITTSANANYLIIEFGAGGTIEPSTYEELMIEESASATPYVERVPSNSELKQSLAQIETLKKVTFTPSNTDYYQVLDNDIYVDAFGFLRGMVIVKCITPSNDNFQTCAIMDNKPIKTLYRTEVSFDSALSAQNKACQIVFGVNGQLQVRGGTSNNRYTISF